MNERAEVNDVKQSDLTALLCVSDNLLERQRKHLKLSLQAAAAQIGCTKPHLHDIEKGKSTNPCASILNGMRRVYGLSAECLLNQFAPPTINVRDLTEFKVVPLTTWSPSHDEFGTSFQCVKCGHNEFYSAVIPPPCKHEPEPYEQAMHKKRTNT